MSMGFGFPGGKLDTITIPATAGNAIIAISPDAKRFIVLRGTLTLVCNGNASNRYIVLRVTDGANITENLFFGSVTVASATKVFDFGEGRIVVGGALGNGPVGVDYLGHLPILLECPQQLLILIVGGLAGDSYSGFIQIAEVDV